MCGRTQPDGSPLDQSQQSFVFWTARMISVDNSSTPNVSITICTPSYEIWQNVNALVDINSKILLDIDSSGGRADPSLQIDPIFNYTAFNGFSLDYFQPANSGIEGNRKSAISTGLLTAIVFQGEYWPFSAYYNNSFTFITQNVYLTYLTLVAREVYFTLENATFDPIANTGHVKLHIPDTRLFVNDVSAHVASVIIGVMALSILASALFLHSMKARQVPQDEGMIATAAIAARELSEDALQGGSDILFSTDWSRGSSVPVIYQFTLT